MLACTTPIFPADLFPPESNNHFRATLHGPLRSLYEAVRARHDRNTVAGVNHGGHSLDHDVAVARFAHAIAWSRRVALPGPGPGSTTTAVVASALMHSYDRMASNWALRQWMKLLPPGWDPKLRKEIRRAVLKHDKPNKGKITETPTIGDILADADKLGCLLFYTILRSGQYEPSKPTVLLGHLAAMSPGSNYKVHRSALDDVFGMMEWLDDYSWFVTPEAKRIAAALEPPLRFFIAVNVQQFSQIGLGEPI